MAEEGEEDRFVGMGADGAGEGLAAFALVFAGCGAIVTNAQYHGALGSVGISLVFGLIIMVMVYATEHLSGAHINPSVTIAFTLNPPLLAARRHRLHRRAANRRHARGPCAARGVASKPAHLGATATRSPPVAPSSTKGSSRRF